VRYLRSRRADDERTLGRIWAITNVGVRANGELTRFLATENVKGAKTLIRASRARAGSGTLHA
jgi:hypothetical protein